jgi:hypothetical protein
MTDISGSVITPGRCSSRPGKEIHPMKIKEFYEKYLTVEDRREFIVDLIEDAMREADLHYQECGSYDPNQIDFAYHDYLYGISLEPQEDECMILFFPLYQYQYDRRLDDEDAFEDYFCESPYPAYVSVRLCDHHDMNEIPMIIRYLTIQKVMIPDK